MTSRCGAWGARRSSFLTGAMVIDAAQGFEGDDGLGHLATTERDAQ
jgi:hypothetical protein